MNVSNHTPRAGIISSNFWPEQTGIGQVTTELADYLSGEGVDVQVATAMPYYPEWRIYDGYRGRIRMTESRSRIAIHRGWHYTRLAPSTLQRILHELTLCMFSIPNMIRVSNADVVYVVSPDLAFAFVAMLIARIRGARRVLIVQDVMPDAAIELGMLRNKLLIALSRLMAKSIYAGASRIYTLGEGMRRRIVAAGAKPEKVHIAPNTIDTAELAPRTNQGRPFRERFVASGKFAVVHAGNMGEKQDLELLLRTARLMKHDSTVHFYVFGDGAVRESFLRRRDEWSLDNVSHFPFQDRAMLPHLLYGADVLLVSQRSEVVDIVVPSKLMTAMGAGAMIVAACAAESETAAILRASGGGVVVPAGDEHALAAEIKRIQTGVVDVQRNRESVAAFAQRTFERRVAYAPIVSHLQLLATHSHRSPRTLAQAPALSAAHSNRGRSE